MINENIEMEKDNVKVIADKDKHKPVSWRQEKRRGS
jgi:hypothetical protein